MIRSRSPPPRLPLPDIRGHGPLGQIVARRVGARRLLLDAWSSHASAAARLLNGGKRARRSPRVTWLSQRTTDAAPCPPGCPYPRERELGSRAAVSLRRPGPQPRPKHGLDERVLIDDLVFQTEAAISIARTIGAHR